ncbi:hypothetical protein FEDK69T_15580 [Flavobacterium enshiense DK69]|nr:hypothetical protein FEDK69T_15580 [Flavobacterium enshiense DK69]
MAIEVLKKDVFEKRFAGGKHLSMKVLFRKCDSATVCQKMMVD